MDLILKKGDHGIAVQELQHKLNTQGAALSVDGWFGDATEAAIAIVQRRAGLVVDGVAGPKTMEALRGEDRIQRLRESDLQAAADRLGVPIACIKAVNDVESRGSGFLADGRPAILLERHIAYRQAAAAGMDAEGLAIRFPKLLSRARGGYVGGAAEWVRFDSLRSVTSQAIAVEACSWGLFQIMGFHWRALGYAGALDFQQAMTAGEGKQLDAFTRFIAADPALLKALKAKKWTDFARLYNGPAFAENLYDAKLAAAYLKAERLAA